MKKSVLLLLLSVLFFSCANQFSLQKRRYNKGFYFAHNHHPKSVNKSEQHTLKQEHQNTAAVNQNMVIVVPAMAVNDQVVNKSEQALKLISQTKQTSHFPKSFKKNLLKIKSKMLDAKHPKTFKKATTQVVAQSILKKVIRKILRKVAYLFILVGLILYGLSFADSMFLPLAIMCFAAAILLLVIGIITRLT